VKRKQRIIKTNRVPQPLFCTPIVACGIVSTMIAAIGPMSGCQLFTENLTAEPHEPYPEDAPLGEVYDIQVFRDITTLRFTNTTTRDFGPSTVWLNKRFSFEIEGFESGETVELDLKLFVDEFGDTYRAGGFFAQRDPAPVVLVQLETLDESDPNLYGLIVVQNKFD
jgi:hypothetical protein